MSKIWMLSFALAFAAAAFAGELDNEGSVTNVSQRVAAANLPATVVVRVSQTDQSVGVLHSDVSLDATQGNFQDSQFIAMDSDSQMSGSPAKNELDQDSSTDSWYFSFWQGDYYRPTFSYLGYYYYYQPYYNYVWAGYYYYYYRW